MERNELIFLNILKTALAGQRWNPPHILSDDDWNAIFHLARVHKVLPLVFEATHHLPQTNRIRSVVRQQALGQTLKTCDFLALNRHLREKGLRPIVVKGIICRSLYPNPDCRTSADEDLLIRPEQLELYCAGLREFGMTTAAEQTDDYEIPWRKAGSLLHIELHKSLFPTDSAAYGDLNRFFGSVFDRAVEADIQGEPVLTMNPTDHLFYLICHGFKHFLHSGFGIRQIADMVMLANRYDHQIHWDQIAENCRLIRAEKFAAAVFRIGEKYLGLEKFPEIWLPVQVDETSLLADVLRAGIYGSAEESRLHSSNITLGAVANQKQGKRSGKGIAKSLFPSAKSLQGRYPYLRKYPFLLPAAWASRMASYGAKKALGGNAAESLKIGAERLELLRQYEILD